VILGASAYECPTFLCASEYIGDAYCDVNCMTGLCNFDSPSNSPRISDCAGQCEDEGCDLSNLGDGFCHECKGYTACNTQHCGFDYGDCGFCAAECKEWMLGNGVCSEECSSKSCLFDYDDCVRTK
jgi:hypothetical protein